MLAGERTPSRDRTPRKLGGDRATFVTGGALLVVAALAWAAVGRDAGAMGSPSGDGMRMATPTGLVSFLVAWAVMMAAMMLPSATPMIALYGAVRRNLTHRGQTAVPTPLFALVYLVVWIVFGLPVYLVGVAVEALAGASSAAAALLPYGVGLVLLAAGIYQLSPLKGACLRVCRSPMAFVIGHWRGSRLGTLRMALAHAAYCVGCCWALMAVLVAAGAMGLHWVVAIAAVVFAEKILPGGEKTALVGGAALVVLGLLVLVQPDLAMALRGPAM